MWIVVKGEDYQSQIIEGWQGGTEVGVDIDGSGRTREVTDNGGETRWKRGSDGCIL